jgi:GrpB-like predicted nucleotidyltransferase (UPF0157 family)
MKQFNKSRPVIIVPYREAWTAEFAHIGAQLRQALAETALRIDHIGSTAVPGLPAKDIIDVQITVDDLNDLEITRKLLEKGFTTREGIRRDNFLGIDDPQSPDLQKRYFREAPGDRRTHIHIRERGRLNQRYALLFRDYLRASATVRLAYGVIKMRLAKIFPDSIDGYLYIKDPLMDMMFASAQTWAQTTDWTPDEDYL